MNKFFRNKTILITWGTGFLGRSLTKRLLKLNPHSIRIFSRDEVKHFKMAQEFNNNPKLRFLVGDIRDKERLKKAMKWVNLVIHAAALKRLDILEYNTEESVKTNIIWTLNLVSAANESWVEKVVFVSTDKACSPVNTYWASKFVSERIITESNYSNGGKWTVFLSVRYWNVINSTWSIVPILRDKIRKKEDFLLTDERMTRFLITEDEAINLIFDAFELWIGWEVFVPKLDSAKIVDLMQAVQKVNNYKAKIKKIGVRPWEKIHELMINEAEWPRVIIYRNRYIIPSLIEKYKNIKKPSYVLEWHKANIEKYSSADSLISVEEIIKKYGQYLKMKE